jgi:Putative amidoligase enzyme
MKFTLPTSHDREGNPRAVGVEIELGGLSEEEVAGIASNCLHGSVVKKGGSILEVKDTSLGDLEVYLDTAFKDHPNPAVKQAVEMGRSVIPIEIVTEPIPVSDLPLLDTLVEALRAAGAQGTEDHLLNGYGVHFNVSVISLTAEDIVPVVRAFALVEDWLRSSDPIDFSRRILPFVGKYPRSFLDSVAEEAADWSLADLVRVYLEKTPTRNRALDLLPLLRQIDEESVVRILGEDASAVKARPTYHYRLPDSRVGEPGWSIGKAWSTWCFVEQVAARQDLLDHLSVAWLEYKSALTTTPVDWIERVDASLKAAFGREPFL